MMRPWLAVVVLAARAAYADPPKAPTACDDDARYDKPGGLARQHARAADYVGKTAAQLRAAFGEPWCASATKWRYERPEGCAYEKDIITLWFTGAKVSRTNIVHIITGEECR